MPVVEFVWYRSDCNTKRELDAPSLKMPLELCLWTCYHYVSLTHKWVYKYWRFTFQPILGLQCYMKMKFRRLHVIVLWRHDSWHQKYFGDSHLGSWDVVQFLLCYVQNSGCYQPAELPSLYQILGKKFLLKNMNKNWIIKELTRFLK